LPIEGAIPLNRKKGNLMKPGKLYGVGIGPGDPQYLTIRAAEVLRAADVIFTVVSKNASDSVSQSVVEQLRPRGEIRRQVFSMSRDNAARRAQVQDNATAIINELSAGRDCAFATLGDAMTYSTFGYVLDIIRQAIPDLELEIVPGVTSFATLAAKAASVLVENSQQLRVIPAFRAEMAESLEFPKGSTTILLKTYHSRAALLDRLAREEGVDILYGEQLAMAGQTLVTDLEAIRDRPEQYLSMIMVKKR
jgi:precorrin-2/cobalt-factor-2 C20-methyltransferase